MAIDEIQRPPLRHLSTFISSGTFVIPDNVNRVYATVDGASGTPSSPGGPAGASIRANGFVEVVPGGTAQVVIGAANGTTSFDGAIIGFSSGGGGYNYHDGNSTGGAGTASFATSLPSGAPAGATVRVTGTSSSTFSNGNGNPGKVYIYG